MMLYQERAERVLQRLKLQSTVKVGELSQLLHVSVLVSLLRGGKYPRVHDCGHGKAAEWDLPCFPISRAFSMT